MALNISAKRSALDTTTTTMGVVEEVGLFDIDLENGCSWSPTSVVDSVVDLFQLEQDILTVNTICSAASVREDVIVRRVRRILKSDQEDCSAESALKQLEFLGFPVSISCSRQKKGDIFHCPRHEFLTMEVEDTSIVIDTNFRSFFAVARSSYYYSKIFDELPETFVGNQDRLRLLVAFMSEQIKRNFESTETSLPPWRDTKSLLNTWAL